MTTNENNVSQVSSDPLESKLLPVELERSRKNDSDTRRAEMIDTITDRIAKLPERIDIFRSCTVGGELHPDKLADALQAHIPANWGDIVRDDVAKTPNEQLAVVALRVVRSLLTEKTNAIMDDRGLVESEKTRSVKKALKQTATEWATSKRLPIKVASATKATRRDHILAMLDELGD